MLAVCLADAAGDLSGTTALGGCERRWHGVRYPLHRRQLRQHAGHASIGANGAYPDAGLIAAAGDLSGTTIGTFTNMDTDTAAATATDSTTTVAATAAPTLTTLVSFNGTNGVIPVGRSDRRRRRGPLRHDIGRRGERRWHGVRDRQDRRRLRQHADHAGQLQRHQRGNPEAGLIADAAGDLFGTTSGRRGERRWHGVRDRQDRQPLRQHADHTGHLQRHQRGKPGRRSDRRRRRGPLRHDSVTAGRTAMARCSRSPRPAAATPARRPHWSASTAPTGHIPYAGLIADAAGDLFGTTEGGRGERRWHGVRDRQDRQRLRQHADHTGQLQRRQRGRAVAGLIADAAGDLFGTTEAAGRTAMARCSRSPRPAAATPARRPHWCSFNRHQRGGPRAV